MTLLLLALVGVGFTQEAPAWVDPHGELPCDACHAGPSEPGPLDADNDRCAACHDEPDHAGVLEHETPVAPPMARRAARAGLPLAEGSRITCATCHPGHLLPRPAVPQLPAAWVAQVLGPAGATVASSPTPLRPALAREDPCTACHRPGRAPR